MTIYYIIVLIILLLGWLQKNGSVNKKTYCGVIGSIFVLVTGLRHNMVGSDTTGYYISYEHLSFLPTLSDAISRHSDIAYYAFIWSYAHAGLPFWCVTLTVSIFFYFTVSRYIYRYSSDCTLSFLILMAFNFFQFSMTGIRQTIALGFILLSLHEAYRPDYRLLKILIYIGIGYLFHNSSAVMLLLIPMLYLKKSMSNTAVVCAIILLLIGFIYRIQIMEIMLTLSSESRYATYQIENTGAGLTTYLVYLAIWLMLVFNKTRYNQHTQRQALDIWILFFAILFQGTVLVQSVMFRIAWYFAVSLIIILPNLINSISKDNTSIVKPGTYLGVLFMYLFITIGSANVVPYKFFWQ